MKTAPEATDTIISRRERIIHDSCGELIRGLRSIDPTDFVRLFHGANTLMLSEEISKFVEYHFKPRTITFGLSGECGLSWEKPFSIALDLELLHGGVFAFFRLWVYPDRSHVELNHISFEDSGASPAQNTRLLHDAMVSVAQ